MPYVAPLAHALEKSPWSVFSVILSSSYGGWGVGSLDCDIEQIAQCVQAVKHYKKASAEGETEGKVVVMGYSMGSQDVLHYLYSGNPLPDRGEHEFQGVLEHTTRPVIDGAILQAPMSNREGLHAMLKEQKGTAKGDEARAAYDQLVGFAKQQPFVVGDAGQRTDAILPMNLTAKAGFPADTPLSARRFLSLASPDSPGNPADDDLFSSDLSDQRLKDTFGAVAERGLLRGKMMFLCSGNDDYAPPDVDKEKLMARWKEAANDKFDADTSAVIPGASHNVKDVGQDELIERVTRYLEGLLQK